MGLFVALLSVGAHLQIPIPTPLGNMPLTFQTAIAAFAAMLLLPLESLATMAIYLGLGLCGLPVFANGGGLGYWLLFPTFGYLIGFALGTPLGALYLNRKPSAGRMAQPARGLFAPIETGEGQRPERLRFGQCLVAGIVVVLVTFGCGIGYTWWHTRFIIGTPIAASSLITALTALLYLKDILLVVLVATLAPRLRKHIDVPSSDTE